MTPSINILKTYIEEGWVEKNDHPILPLSIYNYSRKTQYEGKWDEVTLQCRGLVLDDEGNLVAKSFPKFFNLEEHKIEDLPNEPFEVFEKLDGSLGILFNYKGEWILATKGSFTSDQAVKGMEILRKYTYERLLKGYTYLFEIIYPENRIVCDYGFEDLILLSVFDNKDGYELRIHDNEIHLEGIRLKNLYNNLGFKVVKKYDGIEDYKTLKNMIDSKSEGFVVRFQSGMRIKIKGEEYVRLHRLLTQFSTVDIWEHLKERKNIMELLDEVPDEFDRWVKNQVGRMKYEHHKIRETCEKFMGYFKNENNYDEPEKTKKDFALYLQKNLDEYLHPIMFAMWDNKEDKVNSIIWKLLKPKFSKPFWQKETT